jgi:hypothetical protein
VEIVAFRMSSLKAKCFKLACGNSVLQRIFMTPVKTLGPRPFIGAWKRPKMAEVLLSAGYTVILSLCPAASCVSSTRRVAPVPLDRNGNLTLAPSFRITVEAPVVWCVSFGEGEAYFPHIGSNLRV